MKPCNKLPQELQPWWLDPRDPTKVRHDEKVKWRKPADYTGKLMRKIAAGAEFEATKEQLTERLLRIPEVKAARIAAYQATLAAPVATGQASAGAPVQTPSSVAAAEPQEAPILTAARKAGLVGYRIGTAIFAVLCPWRDEHQSGEQKQGRHDQSTQIFVDKFHCRHKSCKDRTNEDFLRKIGAVTDDLTQVILVIDDSISMTENGKLPVARQQLKQICDQLRGEMPSWLVSVMKFGSSVSQVFSGEARALPDLSSKYTPNQGSTCLFDALAESAGSAQRTIEQKKAAAVLVYLITDGQPTGMQRNTARTAAVAVARSLLTKCVTFVCVGPKDAVALFTNCAIPDGCIRNWDGHSTEDLRKVTGQASEGLKDFAEARTRGETSVQKFWQVDARKLEGNLHLLLDVTALCKVLPVKHEQPIQPFIEEHKLPFIVGQGHYALTKKEKLQPDRPLLVRRKGDPKIYAGPKVRELLGLPAHECSVSPGDMGMFELFLASNSHNRLLVPGTDLIVRLDAQQGKHTWLDPNAKQQPTR